MKIATLYKIIWWRHLALYLILVIYGVVILTFLGCLSLFPYNEETLDYYSDNLSAAQYKIANFLKPFWYRSLDGWRPLTLEM